MALKPSMAGHLVTNLADWFYESGLSVCGRVGHRAMKEAGSSLKRCLCSMPYGQKGPQLSGVFCVGSSLYLFGRGGMKIRLLNTQNQHSHSLELVLGDVSGKEFIFREGMIQRGVGILLATNSFYEKVPEEYLKECLKVRELHSQRSVERRVRELGAYGENRGGRDMGAILLVN